MVQTLAQKLKLNGYHVQTMSLNKDKQYLICSNKYISLIDANIVYSDRSAQFTLTES